MSVRCKPRHSRCSVSRRRSGWPTGSAHVPDLGEQSRSEPAVGFVAMSRPELIALAAFLLLPLIATAAGIEWRRRIVWLAAAGMACALVVLPWSIYNSTRFERWVPLTTSLGTTMLTGNCEPTYHGELLGFYRLGCALRKDSRAMSQSPTASNVKRQSSS